MTLTDFAKLVRDMRYEQTQYFRYSDKLSLAKSKKREADVDKALAKILREPDKQGTLL